MFHPLSTKNPLDLDAAVFLARASEAAYEEDPAVDTWAKANGFPQGGNSFSNSHVQGFWAATGDIAFMALRGTQTVAHWVRNFTVATSKHEWGRVHLGFHDGVYQVESAIGDFIVAASKAQYVWITGHSLGGAMAVIAAARVKMSGIRASVCTFGQPKMGLSDFAERFAIELPGRYARFVNQNDVVPRIPPVYIHFGLQKRIVRPGVLGLLESVAVAGAVEVHPNLFSAKTALSVSAFDSAKAIQNSEIDGPMVIDAELPPLSNQQFLDLQLALQEEELGPALEGRFLDLHLPSIQDHRISEYIRLLTEIRDAS